MVFGGTKPMVPRYHRILYGPVPPLGNGEARNIFPSWLVKTGTNCAVSGPVSRRSYVVTLVKDTEDPPEPSMVTPMAPGVMKSGDM